MYSPRIEGLNTSPFLEGLLKQSRRFDASQRGDMDLNIPVLKIIAAISWGWIRKPQLVVQLSVFFFLGKYFTLPETNIAPENGCLELEY